MAGISSIIARFGSALLGALLLSGCSPSGSADLPNVANGRYSIDGDIFTLEAGRATKHYFPGSSSVNRLWLEGEAVVGDFDGDGVQDAAVHLVNEPGGSGRFHYVAIVTSRDRSKPAIGLFLGDRIEDVTMTKDGASIQIRHLDSATWIANPASPLRKSPRPNAERSCASTHKRAKPYSNVHP